MSSPLPAFGRRIARRRPALARSAYPSPSACRLAASSPAVPPSTSPSPCSRPPSSPAPSPSSGRPWATSGSTPSPSAGASSSSPPPSSSPSRSARSAPSCSPAPPPSWRPPPPSFPPPPHPRPPPPRPGGAPSPRLPDAATLDEIAYWSVLVGFPLLTLGIALGAYWANSAWGRYWGWDPKETSALLTWFVYAGYLHARGLRGWEGKRAAWLLVAGFLAVLFTYFAVNFLISGLHSYSGV